MDLLEISALRYCVLCHVVIAVFEWCFLLDDDIYFYLCIAEIWPFCEFFSGAVATALFPKIALFLPMMCMPIFVQFT
jgi:hypothetical protein